MLRGAPLRGMRGIHENASFGGPNFVRPPYRQDGNPPRRARPSSIFIDGRELEQVMRHFGVSECSRRGWRTGLLIPDLWAVLEPWVKGHESHDIININGLEISGGQ